MGNGQSGQGLRIYSDAFPKQASEQVLVQGRGAVRVGQPGVRSGGATISSRGSAASRYVSDVRSPLAGGNRAQLSRDGRSALVTFKLAGDEAQVQTRVDGALAATAAAQRAHPQVRVEEFGDASSTKALNKSFSNDFRKAEYTSLPVTLLILLFAFGALVAAGVPLLLGLTAVLARARSARSAQPPDPGRGGHDRLDRAADRPRGRRRLLDVLPAPQARGAARRS